MGRYAPEQAKPDYSQLLEQRLKSSSGSIPNTVLYRDFLAWCQKSGYSDLTLSDFEKMMQIKGYRIEKIKGSKSYKNLELKTVH